MVKKLLLTWTALTIPVNISIPNPRIEKLDFTISVIIPCYHKHFCYLEDLLKAYCNQTVLPNEIVISLSEANKIHPQKIQDIENSSWPFELKIIKNNEQLFAGQNRNIAAKSSIYELLICQDADDIPHNQRIELIKYAFDNFEIEHLLHLCSYKLDILKKIYLIDKNNNNLHIFNSYNKQFNGEAHGASALTKKLFNNFQWSDLAFSQDSRYNNHLYEIGYPKYVLEIPLYVYKKNNSSAKDKQKIIKQKIKYEKNN